MCVEADGQVQAHGGYVRKMVLVWPDPQSFLEKPEIWVLCISPQVLNTGTWFNFILSSEPNKQMYFKLAALLSGWFAASTPV